MKAILLKIFWKVMENASTNEDQHILEILKQGNLMEKVKNCGWMDLYMKENSKMEKRMVMVVIYGVNKVFMKESG